MGFAADLSVAPREAWAVDLPDLAPVESAELRAPVRLLVVAGVAVALGAAAVVGVDATTGEVRWRHAMDRPSCVPPGDERRLACVHPPGGAEEKTVTVIDIATGAAQSVVASGVASATVARNDLIVLEWDGGGGDESRVVARNGLTGQIRWTVPARGWGVLAPVGGLVLVFDGGTRMLDPATGEVLADGTYAGSSAPGWYSVGDTDVVELFGPSGVRLGPVPASAALVSVDVRYGSAPWYERRTGANAVEAVDGGVLWRNTDVFQVVARMPDILVGIALDSTVVGIDPATGRTRWRVRNPDYAGIALGDGLRLMSVVESVGRSRATGFDARTGARLWSLDLGAAGTAVSAGGAGLVSLDGSRLVGWRLG